MMGDAAFADFASHHLALIDTPDLLTVSQAAEALNASSQTIRNWIREGRIEGVRIGHRFLVPRGEVERLRGAAPARTGESPWAFDLEEPPSPLPRVALRESAVERADEILGG